METIGRDLMELSLDTVRGDELPLSVHRVVSDDNLLKEILVRLPAVSAVLFKSVSKRWLSLIKSPTFTRRRSRIPNIENPSGLFIQRVSSRVKGFQTDSKTSLYSFAPSDIRLRLVNTFKTECGSNSSNATVLQSCNGLFLCSVEPGKFCVYNPTLNLFRLLPEPHSCGSCELKQGCYTRMAFDPTKSPHYKVLHAVPSDYNSFFGTCFYRIYIYSSETGIWSVVCSRSDRFSSGLRGGIYCNDAIHWINYDYDQDRWLHYKLDFVNNNVVLTKIQPPVTVDNGDDFDGKFFESRGRLLLLGMDNTCSHRLNVYEMGNGDTEWLLKYSIKQWGISLSVVWCMALGERDEDSFMVMKIEGEVVLYKFESKTYYELPELKSMLSVEEKDCSSINSFPFTASFASV